MNLLRYSIFGNIFARFSENLDIVNQRVTIPHFGKVATLAAIQKFIDIDNEMKLGN